MNRPTVVTVIATLSFFLAGLFLLFLFDIIDPQIWWVVAVAGDRASGIVFVLFSVVFAAVGWGTWRLDNWSRIAVNVLVLSDFLVNFFGIQFGLGLLTWARILVGILIFTYIDRPDVVAAFQHDS